MRRSIGSGFPVFASEIHTTVFARPFALALALADVRAVGEHSGEVVTAGTTAVAGAAAAGAGLVTVTARVIVPDTDPTALKVPGL